MTESVTVTQLINVASVAESAKAQVEALRRDLSKRIAQLEANGAVARADREQDVQRDSGVARDLTAAQGRIRALEASHEALKGLQPPFRIGSMPASNASRIDALEGRVSDLEGRAEQEDSEPPSPAAAVANFSGRLFAREHIRSVTDIVDERLRGYSELTVNGVLFVEAAKVPDADLLGRAKDALERFVRKSGMFSPDFGPADRVSFYTLLADLEDATR